MIATYQQILLAVAVIAVLYKMCMLPNAVSQLIGGFLPMSMAPCSEHPAEPAHAPMPKCEDIPTEPQCGLFPNACQWMESGPGCRSRELSVAEKM